MASEPTPTGAWISQARFDRLYGASGLDHDFGTMWGPHRNQRVALRLASGSTHGILYVYDPMWDEYTVLDEHATLDEARTAFAVFARDPDFARLGAESVLQHRLALLFNSSVEPRSLYELGVEL